MVVLGLLSLLLTQQPAQPATHGHKSPPVSKRIASSPPKLQGIAPLSIHPPEERFEYGWPMPSIGGVVLDTYLDAIGLLQQAAHVQGLQGRILWIDGTAN